MANDKVTKSDGKKSGNVAVKILRWFAKLPFRIAKPFQNTWHELRLVTWPTKNELISYSVVVLVFIVVMSVVIGLLDISATALIQAIINPA